MPPTEAVSPVVGVMLMLVVTIIIAAIVSAFAGGMGEHTEQAPVATIDVKIIMNPGMAWASDPLMNFKHLGGDSLKTHDLQIITYYTVPTHYLGKDVNNAGKTIKHTIDGSLTSGGANSWDNSLDPFNEPQVNNDGLPSLNEMGVDNREDFGNYLWRPGRMMQNWPSRDLDPLLGFDIDDKDKYGFGEGAIVHVTIVHKPSGKFIFDKDVEVVW
ncbi:type IV pilin N-terminal domain-containing protein [Methanofollis formosanus]|uniref:type IV pilin N-terminal domain-containing protein n=1 Tax=Methanofollis formosanus TaxID=299308 RepID=UPI001C7D3AA1|nr:type IV pilin N-terminal domain-containing protein [Methanofollis formosanus]